MRERARTAPRPAAAGAPACAHAGAVGGGSAELCEPRMPSRVTAWVRTAEAVADAGRSTVIPVVRDADQPGGPREVDLPGGRVGAPWTVRVAGVRSGAPRRDRRC